MKLGFSGTHMCDLALAGKYEVGRDSEGRPCVVARLRAGAFLLVLVVEHTKLRYALRDLLDEARYDSRVLVQRCVPDTVSPGSPRWLPHPHSMSSIWVELDPRAAERIPSIGRFPECDWQAPGRPG